MTCSLVLYLFMLLQLGFLSLFYNFVQLYNEFQFYFGCAVHVFCMCFKGGVFLSFIMHGLVCHKYLHPFHLLLNVSVQSHLLCHSFLVSTF